MDKVNKIAVDVMGGDVGADVTVPAVLKFLDQQHSVGIILVGLADAINGALTANGGDKPQYRSRIEVVTASEVVAMDEPPALALKKKKDSSMRVAINLVKERKAGACVSAGNTGALMATAKFVLKTIKGIDRPAIISTMPCKNSKQTVHMLDLGANVDSTPEMLLQFALMGSVLTQYVDKKPNPTVGLLNVGAEEIKGSDKVKKTAALLTASSLNYVGFVEGNELFTSKVDLIVCDGFEGNVALKSSEGAAAMIFSVLREELRRGLWSRLVAGLALPILKRIQSRLDPRRHNGATLLGLNGIVVKSHGGTDTFGFLHALQEANAQLQRDVTAHISEEVEKLL